MRILHINDLHVPREGENTYGIDVKDNVLRIFERLKSMEADLLVINGDLAFSTGDEGIYLWIKDQLKTLPFPFFITSGNHDDPVLLSKVFQLDAHLSEGELFYDQLIGDNHLLFLDSTTALVSEQQLTWLETKLSNIPFEAFIFMHHPPLKVGVPYMDNNHSLKNMEVVQDLLLKHPGHLYIFSGHYHVEKMVQLENLTVLVTPSCFFQIDQFEEAFKVDHTRIGLRDIRWEEGIFRSAVHYLEGKSKQA